MALTSVMMVNSCRIFILGPILFDKVSSLSQRIYFFKWGSVGGKYCRLDYQSEGWVLWGRWSMSKGNWDLDFVGDGSVKECSEELSRREKDDVAERYSCLSLTWSLW